MLLIKILLISSLIVSVVVITAAIVFAMTAQKTKKDLDEEGFYD